MNIQSSKTTYNFILQWLSGIDKNKSMTIVDFGCGTGDLVGLLQSNGYNAEGIEVDFFHESITEKIDKVLLQRNQIHIVHQTSDFKPLEARYDILLSHMVYEHVKDKNEFISQISMLLKPKGKALLMFPNKEVWREGHIQQFFIHRLPRNRFRYSVSLLQCKLGIGYKRNSGIAINDYIKQKFEDIDERCHYEKTECSLERFRRHFSICNTEPEYFNFRLHSSGISLPKFLTQNNFSRLLLTKLLRIYSFTVIEIRKNDIL